MGVFRSERMLLCQILLSQETVFDCIEVLGNIGLVEFRDQNASVTQYQRKYVADVRRCEEMERKIRLLLEEIKKSETDIWKCKEIPPAPGAKEMLLLESNLEALVNEIQTVNKSSDVLKRNLLEHIEQYHVIKKASAWLHTNQLFFDEEKQEGSMEWERGINREKNVGHLKITTGVILVEKMKAFEILVWRICHGVAFIKFIHIEDTITDPDTDMPTKKAVFVVICPGDFLNEKIIKICEAFHCNLYSCPSQPDRLAQMETEALTGIKETKQVMQQTFDHRRRVLLVAGMNVEKWKTQVIKLKSIYYIMNMLQLDEINEFQSAECWIPEDDICLIRKKLNTAAERCENKNDPIIIVMKSKEKPPTFNRTNDFTEGFQALIDAYGVSSYREMNPMPFTIITFPFLFAVMFGDVGHGLVLTIFATALILNENRLGKRRLTGEIQKIFFKGRYIILLMGIFSVYTGLIYNDFFSKSINIFGTSWKVHFNASEVKNSKHLNLDPARDFIGGAYYFGIDPVWQVSENKILFLNSYKMKISIVFGVVHMLFGLFLGTFNHVYFREYLNIYAEFIPQVIFFSSLFLYLAGLVIAKWVMYGASESDESRGPRCAPNILTTFINMLLFKKNPSDDCSQMYAYQPLVQRFLVIIASVCVPWLLTMKAAVVLKRDARSLKSGHDENSLKSLKEDEDDLGRDSGEILIRQGIRTIEFVLGSVSHTASYLRLWALSLAHAQLSDVVWTMVLRVGLSARGAYAGVILSCAFFVWAALTVGILALMEGLSAFMHTLRLHWIEFQSKFYSGQGYPFKPYSFERIFEQQESYEENSKT